MDKIFKEIAAELGITQAEAKKVVKLFLEKAGEAAAKGERVILPGYISITKVKRAARHGVNPRTGEKIMIPAKEVLKAKLGKKIQDKINSE